MGTNSTHSRGERAALFTPHGWLALAGVVALGATGFGREVPDPTYAFLNEQPYAAGEPVTWRPCERQPLDGSWSARRRRRHASRPPEEHGHVHSTRVRSGGAAAQRVGALR